MRWSPEGGLKFGIFGKKGQQLKYIGKWNTHTPGTLLVIPSGVLNCLAKLTSLKPNFHSKRVYSIYPDHTNALCEAGLEPPISLTMGEWCKNKDEKWIVTIKMTSLPTKIKQKCLFMRLVLALFIYVHIQGDQQTKKINISWLRVLMSYYRFNNLV